MILIFLKSESMRSKLLTDDYVTEVTNEIICEAGFVLNWFVGGKYKNSEFSPPTGLECEALVGAQEIHSIRHDFVKMLKIVIFC